MRNSIIQLLANAGFSTLVLASTQAASALTLTYTTGMADYVPNPDADSNTRPLQLSPNGNAMNTGANPNTRNFIYQNLVGSYAPAGDWIPVGQSTTMQNEQRFDYYFDAATSSGTGGASGLAPVHNWINNLDLKFGSFYLNGSCSFCGMANTVALINSIDTGAAKYTGESPDSIPGTRILGNQNELTSGLYDIVFGASGIRGTIKYTAFTNVNSEPLRQFNGGTITINADVPNPPTAAVPGPLPVLGAGAAYAYSRRLRRRILSQANRNQSI